MGSDPDQVEIALAEECGRPAKITSLFRGRQLKKDAEEHRARGEWPSSFGLDIVSLNLESRVVSGAAAEYVKLQTNGIIKVAMAASEAER